MKYLSVTMVRDHLDDIPMHRLADGFSMRRFRPGDRRTWTALQQEAEPFIEITEATFPESFGDNPRAMARRSYFLLSPDGREIGSITAWHERSYRGRRWGRIHWVAIVPEFRGRGLSKPMLTVAMNRLRKLGHRRATLGT